MMNKSYYLELLKKKVDELRATLKEINENEYSDEYKKYLLSSYVITLDSILEIGISDLHSPELDSLTSLIYYTRQKIIHYGFFNGMYNMEEIASGIIDLTDTFYDKEQAYFAKLLSPSNFETPEKNVLVKASSNIENDGIYCRFKTEDGSQELLIPMNKVFTLTKKAKEKASQYIINLDVSAALLSYDSNGHSTYKELTGLELKLFLKENFIVTEENYTKHKETIKNIIEEFLKKPVQSSQIMEYASDDQYCRNTIDIIKEYVLENCMFEAYTQHFYLIKDKYSLDKMQKTDYKKLQNIFRKGILQHMTQKDAFFVDVTIKRTKHYFETLKLTDETFEINHRTLAPILIQLFETGPKYFSKQFVQSSPEFKKCYTNLLRYRQIFSHYLLEDKEYQTALENFKNEFLSFVKILQMIDLDDVRISAHEDLDTYYLIERPKDDFFNYKHEQFLEIENGIYIGKKVFYSSRNSKSDKLIALVPSGNSLHHTTYHSKDAYGDIIPLYSIDEKTGMKSQMFISREKFRNVPEIKADLNLANLFTAYSALRKVKNSGDIQIYFAPCDENNNYAHYDDLENVILRFYTQGYIPIELLTKTTLDLSKVNAGVIHLKDEDGNTIANIINRKKYSIEGDYSKDGKRFFSRIDDINHSFSRRRHAK